MLQVKTGSDLMTAEEYLTGETDGAWRHELGNGMVYALARTSENHNVIRLNVAGRLNGSIAESFAAHSAGGARCFSATMWSACRVLANPSRSIKSIAV